MLPCCYPSPTPSSCCWQLLVLLRLEGKVLFRSPGVAVVHSGVAVVMGLLLGFLYQSMQPNLSGAWNRFLGLFAEVTLFALLGLSAVGTWHQGRIRFLRERAAGYYGTLPFYISKFVMDAVRAPFSGVFHMLS